MLRKQQGILPARLVVYCAGLAIAGAHATSQSQTEPSATPGNRPVPAVSVANSAGPPALTAPGTASEVPLLPPRGQAEAYRAERHKSVVELQQFRAMTRVSVDGTGGRRTVASLVDLNPAIGRWYLLRLDLPEGRSSTDHLESPAGSRLQLDAASRGGLVVLRDGAPAFRCELFSGGDSRPLDEARASQLPYAPLCEGRLYLRNAAVGRRTPKELVVDLLRDHVWHGEEITTLVRDLFFKDAFLKTAALAPVAAPPPSASSGPPLPRVSELALQRVLVPVGLGLGLVEAPSGSVGVGRWYSVLDNPGIFVTTLRPDLVAAAVIAEQGRRVAVLDPIESAALVYLVAFDLARFDLGFRLGTDHPRVDWSNMVLPGVRNDALAGPDGIETIDPLVRTGMLNPVERERVAATFTGGFKRAHGAFRWSALAQTDHGSHYGFVENGVVLSKLRQGLATVVVFEDGTVDLRTWTTADDALLPRIRHARQNGVPILERDAVSLRGAPGARVRDWGAGNWSGSADRILRTLRAGLCLQEAAGERFLVYGYFSSATPSSMARVFQAAGCSYAMLLDMNALEHTYLAVYRRSRGRLFTEHLIDGMAAVDTVRAGQPLPRFVSVADNRDFFYLLRRGTP